MLNEKKLTKAELNKREDIIMKMKKNKRSLIDKYGKDAEAVMYGRATNMAKKQAESMKKDRINELIKDALTNPKKADLNKDGKLSDYEKTRGAAIEKNIKETLDEDAWAKLDRLRDAIGDDDYIIQSIMKAMSTDDANLYLDAMIRDHIDIVADPVGDEEEARRKEKEYYTNRGNTSGTIDEEEDKEKDLEDGENEKQKITAKDLKSIINRIKLINPKAKIGPLRKLAKLKDIKETIKQMRSINEKDYPFDKCLDDNEGKYGKEGAKKVCGSIRAAFGEGLKEENENSAIQYYLDQFIKDIEEGGRKGGTEYLNDVIKAIANLRDTFEYDYDEDLDEGLPKGYFKKEFGIGKKKKLKEATGPATIEDTQKAARKVATAITSFEKEKTAKVSHGLDEGSFDLDLNDETYEGGSYTVDSDGDITLVSIAKPSFIGNINDSPETIFRTMEDVLKKQDKEYSGGRYE